jgi:uncharacterized membrane protein
LTAVCAVALVSAVWAIMQIGWYSDVQIVDYGVYQKYGDAMVHEHTVPYRDFAVEYPPAALPVFAVPALLDHRFDYSRLFQGLMALCAAAAVCGAAAIGGPRAAVIAGLAPLALGSVVISRFDFWPAALAVCGLAALVRNRPALSAVLLGTAFAAKLWPAVLVPLAVVWLVRNRDARTAIRWLVGTVATAAVWFLPFVVASPGGVGHSFHSQIARPLQIESLGGAVLIAAHRLAGNTLHMVVSFGSQNLTGPGAHAAAVVTSIAGVLALLAIWTIFARGPATSERLVNYSVASIAALIALGKVFSPQFLIWLIPFVPLVRGRRAPLALGLLYLSLVLTQLWFPRHYWDLALYFHSPYCWYLLARDLAVLALAAVLAWPRSGHEVFGEHRSRLQALQRVGTQAP